MLIAQTKKRGFLKIALNIKERDFTYFSCTKDLTYINQGLITYQFKSVLFGTTYLPFMWTTLSSVDTEKEVDE